MAVESQLQHIGGMLVNYLSLSRAIFFFFVYPLYAVTLRVSGVIDSLLVITWARGLVIIVF